ncbi:hypothetical protein F5Y08DRAFT_347242 [Xylaria arbuscula]|nr:hypothetical protein F5Y08DRAFT_347242 [Xylaria arbuscula]
MRGSGVDYVIRIAKLQPKAEADKILNIRYSNIAEAYMMKGDITQMHDYLKRSRELAIDEFGEGTIYDADVDWITGHLHYHNRDFEQAQTLYSRAYNVNVKENESSMMTATILYKLGCVALAQNDVVTAISQLEEALKLAHFNRSMKGDDGDIARVKRKLADALYKTADRRDEARKMHLDAEKSRREIQEQRLGRLPDTEHSYDLLVACYYRGWHPVDDQDG